MREKPLKSRESHPRQTPAPSGSLHYPDRAESLAILDRQQARLAVLRSYARTALENMANSEPLPVIVLSDEPEPLKSVSDLDFEPYLDIESENE